MALEEGGAAWHPHAAAAARDGIVVFPVSSPPPANNWHSDASSAQVQEEEYQAYAASQLGSGSSRHHLPAMPATALSRGDSMGSVQTSGSCQSLPGADEDEQADAVARVVVDEGPDDDGIPLRPASIMGAEGATALDGLRAGASLEAAGAEVRMQVVYASALYAPAALRVSSGHMAGVGNRSSSGSASPVPGGGAEEAGHGRADASSAGFSIPPGAAGGTALRADASPAPDEARSDVLRSPHIPASRSPAPSSPLDELLRAREQALADVQGTPQRQQQEQLQQPQQQPQGGKRQGLLASLWGSGRSFTRRQLPELPSDTLLAGSGMPITQRQTSRSQAGAPCSVDMELQSNAASPITSDSDAAAAPRLRPGRFNSVGSMLRKHLPPATAPHAGGLVGMAAPDWGSPSVRGPQPLSPGPWPAGGHGTGFAGSLPQPSPGRQSVELRMQMPMGLQQRSYSPAPRGVERSSHSELLMVGSAQGAGQVLVQRSPVRTLGCGRSTASGYVPLAPLGKLRGEPWVPADIAQLRVTGDRQQQQQQKQQEDGGEGDKERTHSPSSCHGPHQPPAVVAGRNCLSLDLARLGGGAGAAASPSGSLPPLPGSPMAAAGAVVFGGGAVASPGSRRQVLMGAEPSPVASPKSGVRTGAGAGQGAAATGQEARERPWEGGRVTGAVQEGCEGWRAAQRGLEVVTGGADSGVALPSLVPGSGGAGVAQGSRAGGAQAVRAAAWEGVREGREGGAWEVGSGGGWTAGRCSLDTRAGPMRRTAVGQEPRSRIGEAVVSAQAQALVRENVPRAWEGPGSDV